MVSSEDAQAPAWQEDLAWNPEDAAAAGTTEHLGATSTIQQLQTTKQLRQALWHLQSLHRVVEGEGEVESGSCLPAGAQWSPLPCCTLFLSRLLSGCWRK